MRIATALFFPRIDFPFPTITFLDLYISVQILEYGEVAVTLNAVSSVDEVAVKRKSISHADGFLGWRSRTPDFVLTKRSASHGLETTTLEN